MKIRMVKNVIAVLLCSVMMAGCGSVDKAAANTSNENMEAYESTSDMIVEAAKTHLGLETISKDKIIQFYRENGNGFDPFKDKIVIQDAEVLKSRIENGSMQPQNMPQELIQLYYQLDGDYIYLYFAKNDKDKCQNIFDSNSSGDNVFYSDDTIIIDRADTTFCTFKEKITDEYYLSGQINWNYVDGTTEHSEATKKLDEFFDAIGAQNPIEIVEKNQ